MKGTKLTTKAGYLHVAEVRGKDGFPIDMLRYDRASPWEETDAHAIERSLNPMLDREPFAIRIVRYTDSVKPAWSLSRWASFHCEVEEIEGYEQRKCPIAKVMMHLYAPLLRPPGTASLPVQPDGWSLIERPFEHCGFDKRVDLPLSSHRFGVVGYRAKLTHENTEHFDLLYLGTN